MCNTCGKVLHIRNSYSSEPETYDIGYSVDVWLARLEGLLRWHCITHVTGVRWLINMPDMGLIRVSTSVPMR